jgi:glutamate/tyrosine decarboxylase-like PLP-dependent enzyme
MNEAAVLYLSDQTHSSLARAARTLGFRPEQVRVIPTDGQARMRIDALRTAIAADESAGRKPLAVVANAGTTATGAVDPFHELSRVCRARNIWLHVDGAYGAFACLSERGRETLAGMELADSITLDPHKWLYQPYECGCLLVRDGSALRRAFEITSDYLRDAGADEGVVNFADYGLQLSRTSRAFKLWMSLRTFGVGAFREAIDRSLDLAELAHTRIDASDALELVAPPSLGIVCFRRRDGGDELTDGLVAALEQSGIGLISSTRVHGRSVLRMCILNHTTQADDVERVISFLETAEPVAGAPAYDRHEQVPATVSLFARLAADEAAAYADLAVERRVAAEQTVVERWDTTRDFFVLEHGLADVVVDGEVVTTLRPGDYFGEIAALEWGAGFARSRAATVIARGDVRLGVLTSEALAQLLAEFPRIEREIRRTAHERLRRAR